MVCPKCSASVADDSNFCRRCGTPFEKRKGFVANLWRENKPGFLILSMLLIAMLGSFGYYLSSRTGRFVVTLDTVSGQGALDIVASATLKEFCRQFPSEMNCTIAISADTEAELLDAAVQHAVAVHRHQDTPELRDQIKSAIKEGTPP